MNVSNFGVIINGQCVMNDLRFQVMMFVGN